MLDSCWRNDKRMSGYDHLKQRLEFYGGNAEGRMQQDKLRTLRKALLYSYQAATCTLADGRKFRCLINPDKEKLDYHNKIISIPYEDIELSKPFDGEKTIPGRETIGMKPGDVFYWGDTNTYWIVYLEKLNEDAYFRAEIRLCEREVEINGVSYHIYWKGPDETTIRWNQNKDIDWNDLNYGAEFYITANQDTLDYLHRFAKVKIDDQTWQVAVVNAASGDGIIKVCLEEYFNDPINDAREEEKKQEPVVIPTISPAKVSPLETVTFVAEGAESGGTWTIPSSYLQFISKEDNTMTAQVIRTKRGEFTLLYTVGNTVYTQDITVEPF